MTLIIKTDLTKFEDEVLATLDKEAEEVWVKIEKLHKQLDVINETKAKYQTALLLKSLPDFKEQN